MQIHGNDRFERMNFKSFAPRNHILSMATMCHTWHTVSADPPPPLTSMEARKVAHKSIIEKRRRDHSRRETISRPFRPIAQFAIRLNISLKKIKNKTETKTRSNKRSTNRPRGYCVRFYSFQLIWFKVRSE